MNAATYSRVSTGHQNESFTAQDITCDLYSQRQGYALLDHHRFGDEAVSGKKELAQRKGGAALLAAAERREFQHLIVAKLDRLGRNTMDVVGNIKRLWAHGITPHVVDNNWRIDENPINEFHLTIMAAVAQLERQFIQSRVCEGVARRVTAMKIHGQVPYGFRAVHAETGLPIAPLPGEGVDKSGRPRLKWPPEARLEIDPEEATHIHTMKLWRDAGIGWEKIARMLNADGVPTKHGALNGWTDGKVQTVLTGKYVNRYILQAEDTEALPLAA
jgi:DNA invertase Pin-like site-specific DNA recombinase